MKRGTILDWPDEERPREKLISRGAEALGPAELLAILVRTGSGGGLTAVDLARELWLRAGESWEGLIRMSGAEITAVKGLGPAKAAAICASLEIARRASASPLKEGARVGCGRDVFNHFRGRLAHLAKENFYCLLLDAKNRVLREERVSEGSLTETIAHPREAYRAAVREAAAGVVFVHNHPGASPNPSEEDERLTERLAEAGRVLGIRFLDHVIIAGADYFSFAERRPKMGKSE